MNRRSEPPSPAPTEEGPLRTSELEALRQDQRALTAMVGRREEFYRSVLESLSEGLLITNAESRIIYANRRLAELTGWQQEELVGQISYEVLGPRELWPAMRQRLRERLTGREEVYENVLVRKDGSRHWIQVRASPYRGSDGQILGTIGALSCIQKQKELEVENDLLRSELAEGGQAGRVLGRSPALAKVLDQIKMVAPTDASVLLLGESGTGKELVARAIHEASQRKPLVRVNCASIPKELFESEFFGHVRGAFTGAVKDRVGRFELADGGTLFLDEVGEIPLELQAKLLRVLQEGQFERVGEERTRSVNVRLIAATNRELKSEAAAGRFRQDLFYRLSVFPIELPPLRERREDIPLLAEHFLDVATRKMKRPPLRLTPAQGRELAAYDWPGNVRELQNVIERAVILARGSHLEFALATVQSAAHPAVAPPPERADAGTALTLTELKQRERRLIEQTLRETGGKIYGPDGAAQRLGLKPTTLASKLQRLGLAAHSIS